MQQMSNLLTASDLTIARRAAYSSLSCDVGQACNSTVYQLQAAMLRAALTLGLFGTDSLSPLLPAEAWGVTLESSCVDGGVRLILPEPVVRLDGSAPTAALFHPTLDGDAAVLKATALVGPRRIGGSTVYVLSLDMNPLPSGGKSLSLRIEEATLVAPLRGPMPKMTLSTPLADCSDPRVVSVTALPIYGSGSLEQEGWGAAVRATVGLRIVFSKDVASRAEDGTLSPLDAASFHVETPNGTEVILGVRMSTSPGARRARRGLLRAEEYTSEAVILLGLPFTPDVNESVRLSVLEGRVIDQQGNVVASGRLAVWANLHPVLPTDLECPWLGGLLASALMAALALLELSLIMRPKEIRISRRFPATRLKQAHSRHQRVRHSHWPSSRSKYLASAPMAEPTASPPPELRWWRQARTSTSSVSNISSIDSCTSSIGSSTSSGSSGHRLDLDPLTLLGWAALRLRWASTSQSSARSCGLRAWGVLYAFLRSPVHVKSRSRRLSCRCFRCGLRRASCSPVSAVSGSQAWPSSPRCARWVFAQCLSPSPSSPPSRAPPTCRRRAVSWSSVQLPSLRRC